MADRSLKKLAGVIRHRATTVILATTKNRLVTARTLGFEKQPNILVLKQMIRYSWA